MLLAWNYFEDHWVKDDSPLKISNNGDSDSDEYGCGICLLN